jgi:rhamnulose-1-phosphate aldolase
MMSVIRNNPALMAEMNRISEVAGYLWEKGWAERNGGNISVNITDLIGDEGQRMPSLTRAQPLGRSLNSLAGHIFYVTGTGKRMRYVAQDPFSHGSVIRLNACGGAYEIIAEKPIPPTSELASHLCMHDYLIERGFNNKVVLHTHPTDLIALTHCNAFLDSEALTWKLWSMIPECRVVVPKGVGVVPYETPGTMALAEATLKQLVNHDVVLWEKHGILAVGEDIIDCFDAIDTLSKSAQIYLNARQAGFEPQGMTKKQMDELVSAFNLPIPD